MLNNDSVTGFHILSNGSRLHDISITEESFTDDNFTIWCFNDSLTSYLQINLSTLHRICAIETKGLQASSNEVRYISSYSVENSTDGREWTFYNQTENVTVSCTRFHCNISFDDEDHYRCVDVTMLWSLTLCAFHMDDPHQDQWCEFTRIIAARQIRRIHSGKDSSIHLM